MKYYSIKAGINGQDTASISIFDRIGGGIFDDGITAKAFIQELKSLGNIKNITLHINSPGGSYFEGVAIYNALHVHPASITVRIEGLAASMASMIAMVGEKIIMPENSMMMIHNPFMGVAGDAEKLRRSALTLDKIKSLMVSTYQNKSHLSRKIIEDMMSEETWLTAEEAMQKGFADEITEGVKIAAEFDLSDYSFTPSCYTSFKEIEEGWKKDPVIRDEFNGNFNSYRAFMDADRKGKARIKTGSDGVVKGSILRGNANV